MTTDVITPAEALEEIERRQIDVTCAPTQDKWYATVFKPRIDIASGASPIEAVGKLLGQIAAAEFMQRPGIQSGLAKLEPLN